MIDPDVILILDESMTKFKPYQRQLTSHLHVLWSRYGRKTIKYLYIRTGKLHTHQLASIC
jgi:hypothetical protein